MQQLHYDNDYLGCIYAMTWYLYLFLKNRVCIVMVALLVSVTSKLWGCSKNSHGKWRMALVSNKLIVPSWNFLRWSFCLSSAYPVVFIETSFSLLLTCPTSPTETKIVENPCLVSVTIYQPWFNRFRIQDFNLNNQLRLQRPQEANDGKSQAPLKHNATQTIWELSVQLTAT